MAPSLSDREIAILEERRQALATVDVATESEAIAGGWMSFAGKGSWANQACALALDSAMDSADLDRLVSFYESRGVEPRIEVSPFSHETLIDGLAQRGFVLREFENILARTLSDNEDFHSLHPFGWPDEFTLERVDPDNAEQVDAHVRVTMGGFVEDPPEAMLETGRRTTRHPQTVAFNAYHDGDVVGTGAMGIAEGVTTLFGVTTLPRFRRRGLQLAMILERLHHAAARHCRLATIHSRPGIPTERNATRVGFSLTYAKVVLVRPGPGLAPSP